MNKAVKNTARLILLAALSVMMAAGCGVYTFSRKGKSDIKSIAVDRFRNETAEYGIEDRMTDQIIDALIADGTLKVVARDYADAALEGLLTRYERRPYQYDENDQVQTYSVNMQFAITLIKPADDSEIWKEDFSQIGVFNVDTETEEDGQEQAIKLLVEAIINRTTKSW
ncbi:MAG: hypothetical protein JSW34_10740 [Candidatus Zixiibacteriota bacterium]|nr:MAG: hypothetical protein JSW34_10740 [candidate division Zixibacteria bacterium]